VNKPRGQRKTKDPCPGCGLNKILCVCAFIPSLDLKTRVVLVVHHKELRRTTNSGLLAMRALKNSLMFERGKTREPLDLTPILQEDYKSLLLFPSESAVELTESFVSQQGQPIQLIVPDGNWRQASKVAIRHPELRYTQHVTITKTNQDKLHLRKETTEMGMATLKAIAEALAIIEGPSKVESLMALYQKKLENTWQGRRGLGLP
jgi:DTW domain-containing protein YfiP